MWWRTQECFRRSRDYNSTWSLAGSQFQLQLAQPRPKAVPISKSAHHHNNIHRHLAHTAYLSKVAWPLHSNYVPIWHQVTFSGTSKSPGTSALTAISPGTGRPLLLSETRIEACILCPVLHLHSGMLLCHLNRYIAEPTYCRLSISMAFYDQSNPTSYLYPDNGLHHYQWFV